MSYFGTDGIRQSADKFTKEFICCSDSIKNFMDNTIFTVL